MSRAANSFVAARRSTQPLIPISRNCPRFSPLQRRLAETVGSRMDRRRRSDGGRADRLRDQGGRGPRGCEARVPAAQGDPLQLPISIHGDFEPCRRGQAHHRQGRARARARALRDAGCVRQATNRSTPRGGAPQIDKLAARGQRVIAFASKPARGADSLELADVEERRSHAARPCRAHRPAAAGSGSGDRRMQGGGDRRQDDHRRSRLDRSRDRARAGLRQGRPSTR